jgi:DNA-binding CsgD family transcriptional regulator
MTTVALRFSKFVKFARKQRHSERPAISVRIPALEVFGYMFYLTWVFLLIIGATLTPAATSADDVFIMRAAMFAASMIGYLLAGFFSRPLMTAPGQNMLVTIIIIFTTSSCAILLLPKISAALSYFAWITAGASQALLLLLWSKHFIHFTRKQLFAISALSFATTGLLYVIISYMQALPALICTGILPLLSIVLYWLANRDIKKYLMHPEDEPVAHNYSAKLAQNSEKTAKFSPKNPLLAKIYLFAATYSFVSGFISACVSTSAYQEPGILFIGCANLAAGLVMLFVLWRYKKDIARIGALFFLPCMAIGIFLFTFTDIFGRLVCLAFLFFLFACNDMINITTVAKSANLYENNFLKTFGFGRFPNALGLLLGWAVGYIVFVVNQSSYIAVTFVCFLLVIIAVIVKVIVFDSEQEKITVSHGPAFWPNTQSQNKPHVDKIEAALAAAPVEDNSTLQNNALLGIKVLSARYQLSPRQEEVFKLLAKGRDVSYIEDKLVISKHTARSHIYSVYRKLDIHSHQELISLVESECQKIQAGNSANSNATVQE